MRGRLEEHELRRLARGRDGLEHDADAGIRRRRVRRLVEVVAVHPDEPAERSARCGWHRNDRLGAAHGVAGEVVGERAGDVNARRMEVRTGRVSGISAGVQGRSGFACPAPAREHRFPHQRAVRGSGQARHYDGVEARHGGTARALSRQVLGRKRADELHERFGAVPGGVTVFGTPNSGSGAMSSNIAGMVVMPLSRQRNPAGSSLDRLSPDACRAPHFPGALPRHHDDVHREVGRVGSRL